MNNRPIVLLAATMLLLGCQANEEPLTEFVQHAERKAQKNVAQLAPKGEFVPLLYSQRTSRNPFSLPVEALVQSQPETKKDCWQPRFRAKSGKLERYPLSKLRLKGVMGSDGSISGLIQVPGGNILKVKTGQYIGLNHGKVVKIENKRLLINETLPDGLGCWQRRNVRLALR